MIEQKTEDLEKRVVRKFDKFLKEQGFIAINKDTAISMFLLSDFTDEFEDLDNALNIVKNNELLKEYLEQYEFSEKLNLFVEKSAKR